MSIGKIKLADPLDISRREERYARRLHLRCDLCPPHKGENRTRTPKHGARKPRSKNRRRA